MDPDYTRRPILSRRAFITGTLQAGLFAVLGGRLVQLQVLNAGHYKTLADENRINLRPLVPERGEIVDRQGRDLAVNKQNFRLLLTPEQAGSPKKVLQDIARIIVLSENLQQQALEKIKRQPGFVPVVVTENLSWEEVSSIEVNLPDLPGTRIEAGATRDYPYGNTLAHVIGYVGAVTRADLRKNPELQLPGLRTGKTGVEKAFEDALRGKAGTRQVEVNVSGREVRELSRKPARPGSRVQLTIDADLQSRVFERLRGEKSASAVILDAQSGAVYALASVPSFNPNAMVMGVSSEQWKKWKEDVAAPMSNKAISGQYPPGSTFKMVTALAALEEGVITPHTPLNCPGHYYIGDHKFHCWKWGGHGQVSLVDALAESCDTFFYKIARDTGIDKIANMARRLGFGQTYNFDLQAEKAGLIPSKDWKRGAIGQPWQPGETVVTAIGQGYVQTTPLQMAVMTARLVNGGRAVEPWLAGFVGDKSLITRSWPDMNISTEHLNWIRRGMNKAVMHPEGTAYGARIEKASTAMGGKTGTSQVRRITMEERMNGLKNDKWPWRLRHHALFVGYAPYQKPRYVCSIVVDHGGSGSEAAAPIARDLLTVAQEIDPARFALTPERIASAEPQAPPHKPDGTKHIR